MATAEKVYIIGIGEDGLDGLTAAARELIERPNCWSARPMPWPWCPRRPAERLVVGTTSTRRSQRIEAVAGRKRVVVLACGDPLFYGVARYLCDKLGKDRFEVVPHVSSMQLAFARVKESWEEAFLTNLANHGLRERAGADSRGGEGRACSRATTCPPAAVAQALLDQRIDYFTAYVCENLGSPDERVTQGELARDRRRRSSRR